MFTDDNRSNAAAIIDAAIRLNDETEVNQVHPQTGKEVAFMVLPEGRKVQSIKPLLDEYNARPERKRGMATLSTLDSFIAHVNRTKTENTVIFVDERNDSPSLSAVYNYNQAQANGGAAEFRDHRAVYTFPISEE